MPCFNVARTLPMAIQSILQQSFTDFELIALDDGSQDETLAQLQAFARRDQRVKILALPHRGLVATLQAGLQACRAPLIARMDADDRAHPDRLRAQVAFMESHPDLAVVGCLVRGFPPNQVREGFRIYIEWLNSLITPQDIAREIFVESPLVHPSVLMRREWLERVGGYRERGWAEDYDLWLRLHLAGARMAKVPQVLLEWREHPDRLTRTDPRYALENFLRAKAHYLLRGPLRERDAVLIWGAGMMGRRLSKHLLREGAPLRAFADVDPAKIGRTRRGLPILAPEELPGWWERHSHPVVLVAVGARGARALIRQQLARIGLVEGKDWWAVA